MGSLHHDIVVEAPALPQRDETMTGQRWYAKFGGKGGNQAVAAARTATVRMVGCVGQDRFGEFLLQALGTAGICAKRVQRTAAVGSGMSVAIQDAQGDYAAVIVSGANLAIHQDSLTDPGLWHDAGILLLQNEIAPALNLAAAVQAQARGVPVCLNAAPARDLPEALARLVDVLVVNMGEAAALCGKPVSDLAQAATAAALLAARFRVVIVTAGAAGVAVHDAGDAGFTLAAEPVPVRSTHGAGDVFTGIFAAAWVTGMSLRQCVEAANRAAAAHVGGAVG